MSRGLGDRNVLVLRAIRLLETEDERTQKTARTTSGRSWMSPGGWNSARNTKPACDGKHSGTWIRHTVITTVTGKKGPRRPRQPTSATMAGTECSGLHRKTHAERDPTKLRPGPAASMDQPEPRVEHPGTARPGRTRQAPRTRSNRLADTEGPRNRR